MVRAWIVLVMALGVGGEGSALPREADSLAENPGLAQIREATVRTRELLEAAHGNAAAPVRWFIRNLYRRLGKVAITVERRPGQFRFCRIPGARAFYRGGTVHFCVSALPYGRDYLAEMMIHELNHAVGIVNECVATRNERAIVRLAGYDPFVTDSPYVPMCGLR